MKDTRLKQDKRKALYSLYLSGLREGRFSSMRKAGKWIAGQKAPHFYISPETASALVGRILSGKSLDGLHPNQQRMATELHRAYKEYLSEHPDTTLSRVQIMNVLVDLPAPEFYMTDEAIRRALREELKDVRKKLGW